jgi:hypothetical protein
VVMDSVQLRLWTDIKNLVLTHKIFPVEGYEFPQEEVAEFWKSVFEEKGIRVFGTDENPDDVKMIQVDFTLPHDPPEWLWGDEESENGTS